MINRETESIASSDQQTQVGLHSVKPRRHKSREVTSRYLSSSSPNGAGNGNTSISTSNHSISPVRYKPSSKNGSFDHSRKPRISLDDQTHSTRGLWPSSVAGNPSLSLPGEEKVDTLADHLGNFRLQDLLRQKNDDETDHCDSSDPLFLNRQKNCTEFSRFQKSRNSKEIHKPVFGKLKLDKTTTTSSSSFRSFGSAEFVPGRLSVDENALSRRARQSAVFDNNHKSSEFECSSRCASNGLESAGVGKTASFSSYMSHTASSRRSSVYVSSKYMQDSTAKSSDNLSATKPAALDESPKLHKSILKNAIKRANSLTGYGSVTSQWALSPGRAISPVISVENKGKWQKTSSNLMPPTSPQKSAKGVEKFLNMGLDLFKTKKNTTVTTVLLSPSSGTLTGESVHRLRLLHNRLMQWRFANAKAGIVNEKLTEQAEMDLIRAREGIVRLQHSLMQKRLRFQRENLTWKLNIILNSQMKPLEMWGEIERQHVSAVSKTKDCLHAIVCRVPLIEGAKVDTQLASSALRNASDLSVSIKSALTTFSPLAGRTGMLLSELAEVVAKENFLIEECLELCKNICLLEFQERSLRSNLIQLMSSRQQCTQPAQLQKIESRVVVK